MKEKEKDENVEEKDDSFFSHGQILLLVFTLVNAYLSNKMYHEVNTAKIIKNHFNQSRYKVFVYSAMHTCSVLATALDLQSHSSRYT